jgi:two-component sensor histidine kinase
MSLIRHAPGPFSPEMRELADLLAARAAVAIETARLHEDALRAAQAQAMLLRELNHRVKNNLASIVALLAMDRPPMPADALAWVNRVGDRIATMARTHELFIGGNDRVELRDLVARLLPALTLIKPRGAEVQTDFEGPKVELDTERAVSLAMVLNELCWNGLEHGTPEDGVLRIRGRAPHDGGLVIEVEDQGRGKMSGADHGIGGHGDTVSGADGNGHGSLVAGAPASGRGTGLRLVEGLVSRELRGRFAVARTAAGGTVARVEFPLEHGESANVS